MMYSSELQNILSNFFVLEHFIFISQEFAACFRQKSSDSGLSSSKCPVLCISFLVPLGTHNSGMSCTRLLSAGLPYAVLFD
jgi:hypothetical protein